MPLRPLLNALKADSDSAFYMPVVQNLISPKETLDNLGAIEDVVMVGYPNGLWDSWNNIPILRKGITAFHPNRNYNGAKEFMIDSTLYPGSSGSPVFIYQEESYAYGPNIIRMSSRLLFMGVLYAGPQFTATGDIHVVSIPTNNRQVVLSLYQTI